MKVLGSLTTDFEDILCNFFRLVDHFDDFCIWFLSSFNYFVTNLILILIILPKVRSTLNYPISLCASHDSNLILRIKLVKIYEFLTNLRFTVQLVELFWNFRCNSRQLFVNSNFGEFTFKNFLLIWIIHDFC